MTALVKNFNSNTEDYHGAFQCFLDHTDQKDKAKEWLDKFVGLLPERRVFVDAGAGNGKVTAWYINHFDTSIALEPNSLLFDDLCEACPDAEVHPDTILGSKLMTSADFILASHVFYYIPKEEWMLNLERLALWLSPEGSLVVMIQNSKTDCMGMLKYFHKKSFDLNELAKNFKKKYGVKYDVRVDTMESHIRTKDFNSAYTVAEFMMNLLPMPEPPVRAHLEEYVEKNFAIGGGNYRFSCHQDFLQIKLKKKLH